MNNLEKTREVQGTEVGPSLKATESSRRGVLDESTAPLPFSKRGSRQNAQAKFSILFVRCESSSTLVKVKNHSVATTNRSSRTVRYPENVMSTWFSETRLWTSESGLFTRRTYTLHFSAVWYITRYRLSCILNGKIHVTRSNIRSQCNTMHMPYLMARRPEPRVRRTVQHGALKCGTRRGEVLLTTLITARFRIYCAN